MSTYQVAATVRGIEAYEPQPRAKFLQALTAISHSIWPAFKVYDDRLKVLYQQLRTAKVR